jgi:predicted nucleic acid-binding protein
LRTALDTNILSILWYGKGRSAQLSTELLAAGRDGGILVSGFTFAESLAHPNMTPESLETFLKNSGIDVDYRVSETVWTLAGTRFAGYAKRRRFAIGESPRRILADFLIGSHALLHADRLMTFDAGFFALNFPELRLYPLAP